MSGIRRAGDAESAQALKKNPRLPSLFHEGRLIGEDPVSPSAHGTSRSGFLVLLRISVVVSHLFPKVHFRLLLGWHSCSIPLLTVARL
jgi:hypothetical protein